MDAKAGDHVIDAFQIAPSLTNVTLSPWSDFTGVVHLPWAQITTYNSSCELNVRETLELLQQLSNIVWLSLHLSKQISDNDPAQRPHDQLLKLLKLENFALLEGYGACNIFWLPHPPFTEIFEVSPNQQRSHESMGSVIAIPHSSFPMLTHNPWSQDRRC